MLVEFVKKKEEADLTLYGISYGQSHVKQGRARECKTVWTEQIPVIADRACKSRFSGFRAN